MTDAEWLVQMGLLDRVENYVAPGGMAAPEFIAPAPEQPGWGEPGYVTVPQVYKQEIFPNEDEENDVGWITDVYTIYDAVVEGGNLPGGAPPQQIVQTVVGDPGGGGQPPAVINQGAACGDDPSRGMVYKKVCGQYRWVKQKRRRRKSLATKGDLQDLASLKGILGMGKAMDVWIATHS